MRTSAASTGQNHVCTVNTGVNASEVSRVARPAKNVTRTCPVIGRLRSNRVRSAGARPPVEPPAPSAACSTPDGRPAGSRLRPARRAEPFIAAVSLRIRADGRSSASPPPPPPPPRPRRRGLAPGLPRAPPPAGLAQQARGAVERLPLLSSQVVGE